MVVDGATAMEINDLDRIKGLCKIEAEVINMMFDIDEQHGIAMLLNTTESFETFLRSKNKLFIRALSIEYRTFITTLLTSIDEPYRAIATSKILKS
jgi:hypothetical protein